MARERTGRQRVVPARHRAAFAAALGVVVLAGFGALTGCKPKTPQCRPESVEWGVQLAIQASNTINLDAEGRSLPTVVRLYQMRGELASEDIDFESLWEAEKAQDLGAKFLSVEELTVRAESDDVRMMPLENDATHILAAALFREPVGTTWFGTYEIPRRHPEVVCSKAPKTKEYPNPCFFVYLDRNSVGAGPAPPSGYEIDPLLQCAPLGVVPAEPDEGNKKWWKRKKKKVDENVQDPLRANDVNTPRTPQTPQTPQPRTPQTPQTPRSPQVPKAPSKPQGPQAPTLPKPN
jgi:type VI secretion system VasD/TssJ family lipoprotein